jgi:hypothetical protein
VEFFKNLSYNLDMKRFSLVLGILLFLTSVCYADEASPKSGMMNMTDEINSSFSQSKNTNWFIHRIKPRGTKIETKQNKSNDKDSVKE